MFSAALFSTLHFVSVTVGYTAGGFDGRTDYVLGVYVQFYDVIVLKRVYIFYDVVAS